MLAKVFLECCLKLGEFDLEDRFVLDISQENLARERNEHRDLPCRNPIEIFLRDIFSFFNL